MVVLDEERFAARGSVAAGQLQLNEKSMQGLLEAGSFQGEDEEEEGEKLSMDLACI